jgi:hypothetical protein
MLKHHQTMSSMITSVYPEYKLELFKFTKLAGAYWGDHLRGLNKEIKSC